MPGRIAKLLILLLIVFLVSYVFYLNPEAVTVRYKPGATWQLPLALVLIVTFCCGAVATFLLSLLVGMKLQSRARRAERSQAQIKSHHELISSAREHLALGDFKEARVLLQKIISKDPDDVAARVLLAETHRRSGELDAALAVLDDARVERKRNIELLLLASEINERLGNYTAAYDNAALTLKLAPNNKFALERVAVASRKLERYEQAVDYQQQLIRVSPAQEQEARQQELAELEVLRAEQIHPGDTAARKAELEAVLRRHREYPAALQSLALIEEQSGRQKEASDLWRRAYVATRDTTHLLRIAVLWLEADEPNRAIETVRRAVQESAQKHAAPDVAGQLYLVKLLLHLEVVDDARRELTVIERNALPSDELKRAYSFVKARLLQKDGQSELAFAEVLDAVDPPEALPGKDLFAGSTANGGYSAVLRSRVRKQLKTLKPPSPSLSTP